jgi:hypothetical protein
MVKNIKEVEVEVEEVEVDHKFEYFYLKCFK